MTSWIEKYGTCEKLHDLGGEFNGTNLIEVLGLLGIRQMTTAPYSPFSNGVVERHNAVIEKTMDKLQNDDSFADLQADILLSHAIRAKNSLLNRHGYSPFQLVFGRDNRLNPIEDNNHNTSNANKMKRMVEAKFEARIEFLKAENELRIKTSLELHSNKRYDQIKSGDIVSYYRNGIKMNRCKMQKSSE